MVVINKYHKRDMKQEKTARTDNVDRSGYIPLDLQHARLMKAGKTLEEIRDYQYNSDYHEVMQHYLHSNMVRFIIIIYSFNFIL